MQKTRTLGIGLALTFVLLLLATSVTFADGSRKLETRLTGAVEIPGPGDPNGRGKAEIEIKKGYKRLCFELEVSRIAQATMAHIHVGAVGVAGPVVVGLTPPSKKGKSEGCVNIDPALGRAIAQNPAQYYVNVHNAEFPAGAVRGQLRKDD